MTTKIKLTDKLIEKMDRAFEGKSEIQSNEGLSRAELKKLFRLGYLEQRQMKADTGSLFHIYRVAKTGAFTK